METVSLHPDLNFKPIDYPSNALPIELLSPQSRITTLHTSLKGDKKRSNEQIKGYPTNKYGHIL